ncbi:DUF1793-domain-containing protein [Xylariaceae sp. FL0662B]|nr:DUF1793-domain-containing protein [Xylariaceae sp. FL0662B]
MRILGILMVRIVGVLAFLPIAFAQAFYLTRNVTLNFTTSDGQNLPLYTPLRPPAVPLAVRSPYTSAWTSTVNNAALNGHTPMFWPGNSIGWEGIVVVDGNSYEYMGAAISDLPELASFNSSIPQEVKFDSQYSNFTFLAGPVTITASFFSPVIPMDICRSSIPLSYLTTSVRSNDGLPHHIQFYSDVNSDWIGTGFEYDVVKEIYKGGSPVSRTGNSTDSSAEIFTWILQRGDSYLFGEVADFPQWGNFSYTTSPMGATNFTYQSGSATSVRFGFVNNPILNNDGGPATRGFGNSGPVYAFAHDMGIVMEASVRYTVGSIQNPVIKYLHKGGVTNLAPWWLTCYGEMHDMIHFHWDDFAVVQKLGNQFETRLRADVDAFYHSNETPVYRNTTRSTSDSDPSRHDVLNGTDQFGQQFVFDSSNAYGYLEPTNATGVAVPFVSESDSYYAIVALSARQVMGSYVFATPPSSTTTSDPATSPAEPLMFQKEISSNGNIQTVDVLYPAMPFFLYANPNLLRYALQPLYEFQEGGFYPNGYCIHDLGTHFPNATGHVEGDDEYMPVEESGNFILMSYAYYKFSGDVAWLTSHYQLLKQFAQYLIQFSLVPAAQLSTDDFAGALVNQTNLAIKGIIGLQAMSAISRLAGNADDTQSFSATAAAYYAQWEDLAIEPAGRHTVLAYQWRSSWGLLYNVYADRLLNLGLVRGAVYEMQSAWYAGVSQAFGVPLDSRRHLTKSDWQLWAAAACGPATRRLLVDAVAYWLNRTSTDLPFTDLYDTVATGHFPLDVATFKARPVVGGHFTLLALARTGLRAAVAAGDTAGSLFPRNGTEALPAPADPAPPPLPAYPYAKRVVRRLAPGEQ